MALGIPASVIGIIVSGDLSGETIYTDRHGRKVHFPIAPPKEPPTIHQTLLRARFTNAQAEWKKQTDLVKADLEALAIATSLCMTGQNLWIHVAMMGTFTLYDTLQRQSGITVPTPTRV